MLRYAFSFRSLKTALFLIMFLSAQSISAYPHPRPDSDDSASPVKVDSNGVIIKQAYVQDALHQITAIKGDVSPQAIAAAVAKVLGLNDTMISSITGCSDDFDNVNATGTVPEGKNSTRTSSAVITCNPKFDIVNNLHRRLVKKQKRELDQGQDLIVFDVPTISEILDAATTLADPGSAALPAVNGTLQDTILALGALLLNGTAPGNGPTPLNGTLSVTTSSGKAGGSNDTALSVTFIQGGFIGDDGFEADPEHDAEGDPALPFPLLPLPMIPVPDSFPINSSRGSNTTADSASGSPGEVSIWDTD